MTAQESEGAALAASFHLDDASLPDSTRSPGDTVKDAFVDDLCDSPIEDFAKTPPKALCDDLFAEAGASEAYRFQYACAFVVPPSIGGSQSIANVWLQPVAEARLKEIADAAVRRHVCRYPADLADVQRLMGSNWVSAYRKYLLPGDQLAPIKPEAHVPDAFSAAPPPVPADVAPAASCAGGAGVLAGADAGDGGGQLGQNDRRRGLQASRRDGRWRGDGRRTDEQIRQRRDEAARGSYGQNRLGRHAEVSRDGARAADGRDVGSRVGELNGDRNPARLRTMDPHGPLADERSAGWQQRSSTFPSRNAEDRGFGSNQSFTPDDRRSLPPRYARGQDLRPNDVRPNDVRPNDVRPNDVRPNDVRPSRPGLGMPRYPARMHRSGYRHRRRR